MHKTIKPSILYYGTPVVLLTTLNEDGSTNISPMSSSWSLGPYIVLGLGMSGKAFENLNRHPECVVNLPSADLWKEVEKLAPLTGKNPVPEHKLKLSFRYEKDKFSAASLSAQASTVVQPLRILECPLQIESKVKHIRAPEYGQSFAVVEVESVAVHAHSDLIINDHHIDPKRWNPLIYNFRHYFGLGDYRGKTFRA